MAKSAQQDEKAANTATDIEQTPTQQSGVASEILKANKYDADEALAAFEGHENVVVDEATNKRLLRRIDRRILPIMCVIYGMNFLDKTTLSYASIMGLREDISLSGDNYQWLASLFYFGYLAWEWPTVRLLQRLPIAKYSGFCIIIWGTVLALFAVVNDFAGAAVIRVLLGAFEAAVTPGWALITSQYYRKEEQGSRTCIWFSFNGFAQIFGGLVAWGIAVGDQKHEHTILPWQILFVFTGIFTVCLGIIFLWLVPDNQLKARWLSESDRILAVARVRGNQQGIGNKHFKRYQFIEAFTDPMVWALVFYSFTANIPNGGITNFFSQLIVSFGYTPVESLLLGTPAGAVQVVSLLLSGYYGDRTGSRLRISLIGLGIAILGVVLLIALPDSAGAGKLVGYYMTLACTTPFVALLSLISSNIAGYTKKTTVAALFLIFYCVGNIIGPQTFRPKDAPKYVPAIVTILVCWSLCFGDIVFIWWYCKRQNRKKAAIRAEPGYTKQENSEWLDLTDRENPEFTYTI
ncbi:uncharacterized protein HMPREF1541_09879 [Cyphellophora europaea CBS 101466]|uniref:Major facilitator superfamily (MFS) profile domain-containing protein n=1 Tax=Cyphellophora europaea (strain CBS 101466) TaxID=1220924 RepID=W2SAF4_CYPE1|nr:uncharacterized protein HMPREF1541_09879 [Cyphellophora europaea CBS 101466]ETN45003.1 hypothetical protein HMPREF1541_09879 [Cyphellophora europaea CBS 101466]